MGRQPVVLLVEMGGDKEVTEPEPQSSACLREYIGQSGGGSQCMKYSNYQQEGLEAPADEDGRT